MTIDKKSTFIMKIFFFSFFLRFVNRFGMPVFYFAVAVAVVVFMIIDTVDSRERLISLLGAVVLLVLGWIFSKHPTYVSYRN